VKHANKEVMSHMQNVIFDIHVLLSDYYPLVERIIELRFVASPKCLQHKSYMAAQLTSV